MSGLFVGIFIALSALFAKDFAVANGAHDTGYLIAAVYLGLMAIVIVVFKVVSVLEKKKD